MEERNFPLENIVPLASARSLGREVSFREEKIPIVELQSFDFKGVDFCFFSAGADVSSEFVPLVVPEVNADALASYTTRNIIANPNCSTIQLVVALAPIHKIAKIKRINVATYQSASGAGRRSLELLNQQIEASLNGSDGSWEQLYAFNVVPQIDEFQENSFSKEEMKLVWETQKFSTIMIFL